MKRCLLLMTLLLAGCGSSPSPMAPPAPPSPGNPWVFQFSPNMPSQPTPDGAGGYYFYFPSQDGVHYLTQGRKTAISGTMTLTANVLLTGNPVFVSSDPNSNACPGGAHVDLYFQRAGDDGQNEFYRWFANTRQSIVSGELTYAVPLVVDNWGDVYARRDAAQFAAAMASPQAVGMTFGVGCFAGHGVYVTGGQATFTIKSFTIQ